MATIDFSMNNLHIVLSGVNGYMDVCTYTNGDPVEYVYKAHHTPTGQTMLYRFKPNVTEVTNLEGFRRLKTDEVEFAFMGAVLPE